MDVVQAMEQSGAPNEIHMSPEFAAALAEAGLPDAVALGPASDLDGSRFLVDSLRELATDSGKVLRERDAGGTGAAAREESHVVAERYAYGV